MNKLSYTPRIASEVFDTSVMKTEEVILFVKAATENGSDLETAYDDMRMIDDILHLKRLHLAVHGQIKKTKAGHLRKGTSLYDAISDVIGSRCISQKLKSENNVGAVGDVPLQRTSFIHALSCGILPTACYRIVLFFVRLA